MRVRERERERVRKREREIERKEGYDVISYDSMRSDRIIE